MRLGLDVHPNLAVCSQSCFDQIISDANIRRSCSACASFACVTSGLQPVFPISTVTPGAPTPSAANVNGALSDTDSGDDHHENAIIGGSVGGGLALLAVLLAMIVYAFVLRRKKLKGGSKRPLVYRGYVDDNDSMSPGLVRARGWVQLDG